MFLFGRGDWEDRVSAAVTVAPGTWKDTLYVGTETELAAFELTSGGNTAGQHLPQMIAALLP
jgi:hypothetical protein